IQDRLLLQGQFSAQYHQSGKWQCEISNDQSEAVSAPKVRLSIEPYKITSSIPEFKLSAKAESQIIDAAYMLKVPAVQIASTAESIQIPQLTLEGTAQISNGAARASGVTFDLRAPNTGLKLEGTDIKISDLSISGKLNRRDDRLITLDGLLQISGAGGIFSNLNISFSSARAKIPFKWPLVEKSAQGRVSIANLKYNSMNLGSLISFIRQSPAGFVFEGRHQSTLLPRMILAFTGESRLFRAGSAKTSIHFDLQRPGGAANIELGKLFPAAAGVRLNGKLQLSGDIALSSGGFSGRVKADFANGNLLLGKNKLALEGLRMSLSLPELPKLRSAPRQQIYFNKISLGDIVAQKGRIDFQIESASSLLIEKMHFIWCEGNVESQAMRISPGIEDYRLTFHCDRLSLAKVLEQFGAAAASGRGSVNGRIPLQYTHGKIRFEDGFLFSTPGEGGKIHLTGTDILTAGIPPNTNQYVQMELAREALKDYDYSWAKLNINSEGEELLLQMQMDGKPARTLPFVYRKDIGGFMKVEADAKGSKFQGIRLDVNFRLPLDKLMQYKELIEMIK
ncbi:MAG: YdbH domain-containing protein, partial [Deltaproteobacteria bacterium]|nr:YdbH domain-containing protein [Deltaproteobacteria bacterium]